MIMEKVAQGFLEQFGLSKGKVVGIVVAVLALVVTPWLVTNLWENLEANEIMVIQSPLEGTLTVYTDPGVKWQGFGKVTKYPRRETYAFQASKADEGNAKKLRFNDGGHALLSGSVSWEMPLKPDQIINIHKTFGSAQAVDQQAIAKMIDTAVYLAGPLMSSTESTSERRAELVQAISDQAENGVYVTRTIEKDVKDSITGQVKHINGTEIVYDDKGLPKRQQGSMLAEFNIKLLPLSITELRYDSVVENQIKQRQEATTQVQIAQAQAKKAEQAALTAEAEGRKAATEAKWKQETIKAQAVTEGEQKLKVAELAAKEAEQYKREQVLRGEGDAAAMQLRMQANGALDQKLEAIVKIQQAWADAYAKHTGSMVPQVVFGGTNGANGNSLTASQNLVELLTAQTAKQLGTDLSVGGQSATKK